MPDRMDSKGEKETRLGASTPQHLTRGVGKTAGAGDLSQGLDIPAGLGRRFVVGREILRDSIGVTYEAEDRLSRRKVALKRIFPFINRDPARLDRLVKELNAARLLHHPGIVTIHDLVKEGDALLYTMEPLGPVDLLAHARARGAPSLLEVMEILTPVCNVLKHLHPGRVHGALCAHSIVFTPEGAPKLLDFGISKPPVGDADLDISRYLAPEVHQGGPPPDLRADLWGLGLTLFETLTGQLPAKSIRSITVIRPDLPSALDEVFRKTICPAERRYESVQAFTEALAHCARQATLASRKPGLVDAFQGWDSLEPVRDEPASRPRRLSPKLVGSAVAVLAGVCLLVAPILWMRLRQDAPSGETTASTESHPSEVQEQDLATASVEASAANTIQAVEVTGFWAGDPFALVFLDEQGGVTTGWYYVSGDPAVHFFGTGEATRLDSGQVYVVAPLENTFEEREPTDSPFALPGLPERATEPTESGRVSVVFGQEADKQLGTIEIYSAEANDFGAESDFSLQRLAYTHFLASDLNVYNMTGCSVSRSSSDLVVKGGSPSSFALVLPVAKKATYRIGAFMTLNRQTVCQLSVDDTPLAVVSAAVPEVEDGESDRVRPPSKPVGTSEDEDPFKESETQLVWFGTATLDSGNHLVTFGLEDTDGNPTSGQPALMLHMVVLATD